MSERLVRIGSGRGIHVAEIALEEVRAIYEVRLQVERLAARLFMQNAHADHHRKVTTHFEAAGALIESGHHDTVYDLDHEFHDLFFEAAHNPFLNAQDGLLEGHYQRLSRLTFERASRKDKDQAAWLLVRSHDGIIAAVQKKSATALDDAMCAHIEASFKNVLRTLSEGTLQSSKTFPFRTLNGPAANELVLSEV